MEEGEWDVAAVLGVIRGAARTWRPEKLRSFPELRCARHCTDSLNCYALSAATLPEVPAIV